MSRNPEEQLEYIMTLEAQIGEYELEIARLKEVATKASLKSKVISDKLSTTQWENDIMKRNAYENRYANGGWR